MITLNVPVANLFKKYIFLSKSPIFVKMRNNMKGLIPIGFSDFREIIERGYRYIDKSRYIHSLCTTGKYYFLSRPRRFGKSLTISLIKELYSGSKNLFKDLWIEDKWDWDKRYPIIHISLKSLNYRRFALKLYIWIWIYKVTNIC